MNINKAIRKQNKSLKRFLFSESFIFFVLILILTYFDNLSTYLKITIIFMEALVVIAMISKLQSKYLKYVTNDNKISIKTGILDISMNFRVDNVVLVHTEDEFKDIKIILIIASKIKRRRYKKVNDKFLRNHKVVYENFKNIKHKNINKKYYYIIIEKGSFMKYKLLNDIYIKCTKAFFTDEAIDRIKQYRN
ncbi:hypothetical protein ACFIJ5_15685 [Haloimpatiens sp. FM7330]|uniref:hypothetical protein n=1 Tax=Haloimpatiens sp. FM7330 TaxID=3298610 RepID=UPI0036321ED2